MNDNRESWNRVEQSARKSLVVTMLLLALVVTLPGVGMWQWIARSQLQGGFVDTFVYSEVLSLMPLIFGTITMIKKKSFGIGLLAANCTSFALLVLYLAIFLL
jgi:hypothetical protein